MPLPAGIAASQDGLGPRFRQALEMLVEAHRQDLHRASTSIAENHTLVFDEDVLQAAITMERAISNGEEHAHASLQGYLKADAAQNPSVNEVILREGIASSAAPKAQTTLALVSATADSQGGTNASETGKAFVSEASDPSETDNATYSEGSQNGKKIGRFDSEESQISGQKSSRAPRTSVNGNAMAGRVRASSRSMDFQENMASVVPVDEPEYDVTNYYHSEGKAQAIATSSIFGNLTLLVIGMNALYMGFDADYNDADSLNAAHWSFILCENLFCIFFSFEWGVRFCSFKAKCSCLRDGWFKFDSFLLVVIIFETWVMTLILELMDGGSISFSSGPLRLLRLLRLARLVRLMRAFPELLTMVHGMMVAMRAVGSAMILLVMALYAWGITMHSFLKDDVSLYPYWGTVSRSMMTLLANGALGDSIGTIMRDISGYYPALIAMLAFVVFAALTVLNMLVGVLCEVVAEVSHAEKEEIALYKLKDTVLVMLKNIDEDGGGTISRLELAGLLCDETAVAVMNDLNIDAHNFLDMADMHFQEGEDLTIGWIMKLLVDNQGGRPTTVQDLCHFNAFQGWRGKNQAASTESALRLDLVKIQNEIASLRAQLHGTSSTSHVRAFPLHRSDMITIPTG